MWYKDINFSFCFTNSNLLFYKFKFVVIKNHILKRHEIWFLLCTIIFSFCWHGTISYFTQAKTSGLCIFDSNIFFYATNVDYIGNQTRLNSEKSAQTLSYDRILSRLVGVPKSWANSVESDFRLDRITPPTTDSTMMICTTKKPVMF